MIKEAAVTVAAVLPRRSLVSCSLRGILSSSSYSLADKEVSEKVERERARSEWEKWQFLNTHTQYIMHPGRRTFFRAYLVPKR